MARPYLALVSLGRQIGSHRVMKMHMGMRRKWCRKDMFHNTEALLAWWASGRLRGAVVSGSYETLCIRVRIFVWL